MEGKSKILIIDDDQDFTASTRALLESKGYKVVAADSGKVGLDMLASEKPDAIVLDIMMESDTAGYGVNAAIKHQDRFKEYRSIPILMCSSIETSPGERFPNFAHEVGMIQPNFYFTKPLESERFLEVLEQALKE